MKERALSLIRETIYHPVNARVVYDAVIAFTAIFFSYVLLSFANLELLAIISLPIIFVSLNLITGVYSVLRLSPSWQKSAALTSSSLFSFVILYLLGGDFVPLFNASIFIAALTSIPRIFLNFSGSPIKDSPFNHVIHTNSPILVVGGGGYIGSVLVERMLENDMKVRVFDKFIYGRKVFDDLKDNTKLEIVEGDATDIYSLTLALKNVRGVVHLAGIVGDPASMVDDRLTRHMNIVSTRMVKEAVKGLRIPKFIFASSCSVYGSSNNIVDERSRLNPLSPYAKSKIDSEKELLQDTFDEFNPTILRLATVFGHSRKPRFDLVVNLFVAQALDNGFITVTGEHQWRPFIHVRDVADGIIKALDAPISKMSRQIFNVGDEEMHITIGELANTVQRILAPEKNVKVIVRNDRSDLRNYRVSFKKIKEQLGFSCRVSIEEGIREILENFKKGTYKKPYTDVYYSALETTKEVRKEFYSESYRKTHFSDLSFPEARE